MPSAMNDVFRVAPSRGVAFRLWAAAAAVIVLLVGLIAFSSWRSAHVQDQTTAITVALDAKVDAARRWAAMIAANVVRVQASAASTDPVIEGMFKDALPTAIAEINKVQQSIDAMALTPEDRALLQRIAEERKLVLASTAKLRALKGGEVRLVEQELAERFMPAVSIYMKSVTEFADAQVQAKSHALGDLDLQRKSTVRIAALLIAGIVAALLLGARWLVRSIQQPLVLATEAAERIAGGDLRAGMEVQQSDEFGLLLRAMDRMAARLGAVVGEVRQGVESVSTAAGEIAQGNQDLSARTEQTASNLEQTASAMEQLTATVGQAAETAGKARELAGSAAGVAGRGGAVVEQVVGNMAQITESSRRIADIIGVIDGIAFQTNILALNAAVEAARAGEQGRGFAVVAGEVRTLAQRSAEAAKEIKGLIGVSVERVESGSQLVARSGAVMTEIVSGVQRVTDLIGEIATSAGEQRDGIAQINQAVAQLDQMTQQNAALVEESAAAAQSLREQSQRLAELVAGFRT